MWRQGEKRWIGQVGGGGCKCRDVKRGGEYRVCREGMCTSVAV